MTRYSLTTPLFSPLNDLQHPDGIFKMPVMGKWVTVVTGKYLDEILHAPETSLSFHELLNDVGFLAIFATDS